MTPTQIKRLLIGTGACLLTLGAYSFHNFPVNASFSPDEAILLAQNSEEKTRIEVYKKASPAVVMIRIGKSQGSGFIVTSDGLLLTNHHVINGQGTEAKVILADGEEVIADVIGTVGPDLDLAALKIRNSRKLPHLKLASPDSIEVGQTVYAIGSPYGYQNSMSEGIVSAIRAKGVMIQHDAAINTGNSGGPLLNSKGEVIGVNTWIELGAVIDDEGNPVAKTKGNIGISWALSSKIANLFLVAVLEGNVPRIARNPQPQPENLGIPLLPTNGQVLSNRLQSGDPTLPNNSYYHTYAIQGKAGQRVKISVNSREIDPSVLLISPDKRRERIIAQNDDVSAQNFNAQLETILPQDGIYYVFTSAFEPKETGNYQISVRLQ